MRQTRSGREYNPWTADGAEPIVVSGIRVSELLARRAEELPDSPDSEDEGDGDGEAQLEEPATPARINAAQLRWRPLPPLVASTASFPPPSPLIEPDKKTRKKARQRISRNIKREAMRASLAGEKNPKAISLVRHRTSTPISLPHLSFSKMPLPVTTTGWMGLQNPPPLPFEPEPRAYSLEEATSIPGMRLVDWDGVPAPVVDGERFVIALLGGRPNDPRWVEDVAIPAAKLMQEAADDLYVGESLGKFAHRRGDFHNEKIGCSMGGGQEYPCNFMNAALTTIVLTGLLATKPFQRIVGFTNQIFQAFQPKLHAYYRETMEALTSWDDSIRLNFPLATSVFAAITLNFGPATVTFPHIDFGNLAWGWCCVTALGNFDPDKGGHLILWDLMLVIRFPPGTSIFIPSAIARHSNTSIQKGETRFSFAQYTAAGIFRFVKNGFRTEKAAKPSKLTDAQKKQRVEERKKRWIEGLRTYRTWDVAFE